MPFSLFLALKYLKPKRSITSVVTLNSVVGVMLGVAILIIVRAVMTGFGDMWQKKILDFKPHITVVSRFGRPILDEEELCRRYEQIPGVVAASPGIETRVLIERDKKRIAAPILIGIDPERALRVMKFDQMDAGEFNVEGDSVVLGTDLALEMGLRVGDPLFVYSPMNLLAHDEVFFPERLTVSGIYNSGHYLFDSGYIITSLEVARDMMDMRKGVYSIHLKVDDPQNVAKFDELYKRVMAVAPDYDAKRWQDIDSQLFNALAVEKNMMVILLMFIMVVAIFCVTNTLIVLTVQKTDEIGLLKALGFASHQVMFAFVLHGWIQCLVGTLLGVAGAVAILENLNGMVELLARMGVEVFPKSVYGLAEIPWRIVPSEVMNVAVSVILFCTVASFLPAWRASRMDPVTALRKE